jgi:transcription-repair coupling factor (superfamily II helicase)
MPRREEKPLKPAEFSERVLQREGPLRLLRVQGSAGAYLVGRLRRAHPGPLLVIAASSQRAERFATDLRAFAGGPEVPIFPRYDVPPFDRFSPHPELESRRMSLLYRLLSADDQTPLTLVAPWSALLRRVLPRQELRDRVTHLERDMTIDRDALLEVLIRAGYHHTALVEERGEVASRGGILDIFPPQLEQPIRLEFEFEAIGSIRCFDPSTQRSSGELRNVVAIPPKSWRLPNDLDALLHRVRGMGRDLNVPESNIYAVTEVLARRGLPPGAEGLEALFHDSLETVLDYLPPQTLIVIDDPEAGRARAQSYTEEVFESHAKARHEDRLACDPLALYTTGDTAWDEVARRKPLLLDGLGAVEAHEETLAIGATDHRELRREIRERQGSGRALQPLADRLESWRTQGRRVRLSCPTLSAAERLVDILEDYGHALQISDAGAGRGNGVLPEPGTIDVAVAPLTEGFDLPLDNLVILTEQDIFGTRARRRIVRAAAHRGESVERLAQIQEGDYLVHAEHGIGQYGGLLTLTLAGIQQEFLLVTYDKGDKLYLPVSRLAQIQRYSGADEKTPRLDRLGGNSWSRTKARVRRAIRDMAEELLAVIAAREVLEGFSYPPPAADYEEFEARFPYEDTPDQRRATQELMEDMQRERPMDRLVCGDVGFGKTEIACRAAYRVTAAGRQVAFLVPTTVLCQQHLQTLRERFEGTAVEIASLSRLSNPKQIRETREHLASGRVDVVVGTHRLLSKDVTFRNLGLVIVDEEHRFGVAHKERLKQLRKLVDVLTLSATPIPRTLQMSLTGLRDLSVITTPPPDRIAIRTQVCRFSDEIVRDSIQREMRRGGQVFFVHNRVETIQEFGEYLQRTVPGARIAIAHGQMGARELDQVMLRFVRAEVDVLLCTAIIESGLDIPNANTILIHRADHFGLAQLYQLRGRVGRSDRRAYAYLLLPPQGSMTEDARRRIDAIQDLSELGAGFRLATEDLEIRGAGNLLGGEQSGHVASVGYDLYMDMLKESIAELKGQALTELLEPEIRLPFSSLLPERFVPDVNQRLVLYKQLSSARDDAEVQEIKDDLLDRFGPLPQEAVNLLEVIRLKIRCRELGIEAIDVVAGELVLQVHEKSVIDPSHLVRLLAQPETLFRVTPEHKIFMSLRTKEDALAESFGLLDLLSPPEKKSSSQVPSEAGNNP